LLTAAGLVWTHRNEEEQAILDGGWWNALFRVVLPKVRVWTLAGAMWCAVPILTEMVVSNLYQVPTVAEQIYLDASSGTVSLLTYVSSFSCCVLPLFLGMWVYCRCSTARRGLDFRPSHFRASVLELYTWRWPVSLGVWLAVAILVFLPIASLLAKAGWQPYTGDDGLNYYGWSVERLGRTAYESITLFQEEYYWSGLMATLTSSLALITAALVFAVTRRALRVVMSLIMVVAIAIPGPAVGMLVIWLINRSQPAWLGQLYDHSLAAPVLAQQFRLLPLAWLMVGAIVAGISRTTWEQTQLEGLSCWDVLRRVLVPQASRMFLAAWLLLAVLSVGELSCTILLLPPGVTTISMRLFEMLHFGMRHQDSGLCGVLLLGGWLVSWVLWKTLSDR
jgi:iron(III) transport system permease protein